MVVAVNINNCDRQEMERAQLKGDVPEDELRALEMDVTGKVSLPPIIFDERRLN